MKGLSSSADLTPLIGREVLQLCIGMHQLQIHFDNHVGVMVESECVLRGPAAEDLRVDSYALAASSMCTLLGQQVQSASRTEQGGLLLRFTTEAELEVLNDSSHYESFQIHIGSRIYVA